MSRLELEQRIAKLPRGGITVKRINGKEYSYYQWSENGKQRSHLVKGEELQRLSEQIAERKRLEYKLWLEVREATDYDNAGMFVTERAMAFSCSVLTGKRLEAFANPVREYRKRSLYEELESYIHTPGQDKVLILYGLRRTGKTTLIRQAILNMTEEDRKIAAFIQIGSKNTMEGLNQDLRTLEALGYRYVFIDEVTLLDDFIEGAALFSDIYCACGMKIVLSGTDSLGFVFSEDEQLYDRCILVHTTFIPFKEFSRVLGINDIEQYIRYGGTMSRSGENYNKTIFSDGNSTNEYVNSAIARNIQHSLRNYQHGGHFRSLQDLYEHNELTNVINRIVEDMNHRFTLEVLTRDFKSHDFGSAKDILRKDRENPTDILDLVDGEALTRKLMELLEILNKKDQSVEIQDVHRSDIKDYLKLLDLVCDIPVVNMNDLNGQSSMTVFTQPGLRYSQAQAFVRSLMASEVFSSLSAKDRASIIDRILDEIRGRMLEEIVLLETKKARPQMEVFKLQFAVGEFDMVVFDQATVSCEIFEVKHTKARSKAQYRHLVDSDKCSKTAFRYGDIKRKVVLYRGENATLEKEGITYLNVEEYLASL